MGIGFDAIDLIIRLKEEGYIPSGPAVVEVGAQQLANSFLESQVSLEKLRQLFEVGGTCPLPQPKPQHIVHGSLEHQDADAPFARDFWKWLGFNYASIDIDGSPGSIPLDLNYDDVPENAKGKYNLVTNFGTTEHVANQLNAFKVIHELTAPGGVMLHHLPAQGMYNHGLVNYNPKFFWMLARSNGYKVVYMDYQSSTSYYDLPQNIVDNVVPFKADIKARAKDYRAADSLLVVMLQKNFDIPYVAPLDVPTGIKTDNKALEERYWTVFKPNAFDNLPRYGKSDSFFTRVKRRIFG